MLEPTFPEGSLSGDPSPDKSAEDRINPSPPQPREPVQAVSVSLPQDHIPEGSSPGESSPEEPVSLKFTPNKSVPKECEPEESSPEESAPEESCLQGPLLELSAQAESAAIESAQARSLLEDYSLVQIPPGRASPSPNSQSQPRTSSDISSEDVAKFLSKIHLPEYANIFKSEDISGDVLLFAELETFSELGVTNPLHQMKIMHLFKRELKGNVAKYPIEHVARFLHKYKLDEYIPILEENGIDGDMILEVDESLMKDVLERIDVVNPLHQMKIMHLYKREMKGGMPRYSTEHLAQFLQKFKFEKYIPILENNEIDGDMILEVDEKLMKSILKVLKVTLSDAIKIRSQYKGFCNKP